MVDIYNSKKSKAEKAQVYLIEVGGIPTAETVAECCARIRLRPDGEATLLASNPKLEEIVARFATEYEDLSANERKKYPNLTTLPLSLNVEETTRSMIEFLMTKGLMPSSLDVDQKTQSVLTFFGDNGLMPPEPEPELEPEPEPEPEPELEPEPEEELEPEDPSHATPEPEDPAQATPEPEDPAKATP